MEGLLAEIQKKKVTELSVGDKEEKYLSRGEKERLRKEAEQAEREKREAEREARQKRKADDAEEERAKKMRKEASFWKCSRANRQAENSRSAAAAAVADSNEDRYAISPEECTRRLRLFGEPVRYFGETDAERKKRLKKLELESESRGGLKQNDFKKAKEDLDRREQERRARGEVSGTSSPMPSSKSEEKAKQYTSELLDLELIKTDFNKLHPIIFWNFKSWLKEWEEYLEARSDDVKKSAAGKLASTTQLQSAQNLKPLFKKLRSRDLDNDVVVSLAEIVHFVQRREYRNANDSYLKLSIGNAAWPLGVTSVGIHERSSDSKITHNVAHVLNDEVSRKYIQAVKR